MTPSNPRPAAFRIGFPLATAMPYALKKLPSWLLAAFILLAALCVFPALAAAQQSTVPGAPTDFSASRGTTHRQVLLAWRPPEATGGSPITQYVINYAENAAFTQNLETIQFTDVDATSNRLTKKIPGLDQGTRYYFRVAAENANGQGAWSDTENATPLPVITVAAVNKTISEGASAEFRVRLWPAPTSRTHVTVEISVEGSYGVSAGNERVTFPANENSATLILATTDDTTPEADGSIIARVRGQEGYAVGIPRTATINITNDDENQAPTVNGDGDIIYAENGNGDVATYTVTDPNTEDRHEWSLEGDDMAAFSITDGVLRFTASPDFETKSSYSVTVKVTDNGDPVMSGIKSVNINITDANDAPVVAGNAAISYAENDSSDVATYTVTDQDAGDEHTWSVEGTHAAAFNIGADSGVLSFKASPDFETQNLYEVTVLATDDGDPLLSDTFAVTVTITDINEASKFTVGFSMAENETFVGNVSASDEDSGDTVTAYNLGGTDKDLFAITDAGALSFISAPDFETPQGGANDDTNTYEFTVTVMSGTGDREMTATQALTVTITDANDAPIFTSGASFTMAESQMSVGTVSAADQDSADSVTNYQLLSGTDFDLFTIATDGALSFNSAPDFENPQGGSSDDSNTYELTVTVTSGSGERERSATQNITVIVTDGNDAPGFTSDASFSVAENQTSVGTVSAADQDSVDSDISYTWRGTDFDLFTIAADGALSFISAPDFENPQGGANDDSNTYELMVTVTSGTGDRELTATQDLTVTVTDVSEQPEVTGDSTIDFAENDSIDVATYTVTDPVADSEHDWTVEGADFAAFTITNTGALSFMSEPDYETQYSYEVTVKATDKSDPTRYGTHAVVVTITDENEAPAFTSSASFSLAENQTAVATVTATDQDSADSVTGYEPLSGADKDLFTIATDGALSFISDPDFETPQGGANDDSNTYELMVTATSGTGERALIATQNLTVTITDANDVPVVTGEATVDYAENDSSDVATFTVTDQDAGVMHTWSVEGTDDSAFSIGEESGVLSFKASPDFETQYLYEVTVIATDDGDPAQSGTYAVTITVTDENDAPMFTSSASFSVAENQTAVDTVAATDQDSADSVISYEPLTGADKDLFTIATDGALSFISVPDFETPQGGANDDTNTYELTVSATSGTGERALTATQDLTITVTDANDVPMFTSGSTFSLAENQTSVDTVTATDQDSADSVISYEPLTGADKDLFTIATDGALSFNSTPDFENPQGGANDDSNTYELTVTATSGTGSRLMTATQDITVTVTDLITFYRQKRTWTGRNPDNNADVTLTTYGTWTSDSANVPQDAPGITSETSTETNENGERRDTIIWTDGANTAYQRSAFYAPMSMEYRERQEWGGTETNALSGEPTRGYTFGAWQDTPPAESPHPELWNEPDLPPGIVPAGGTERRGGYQDEWSRVWRIADSLHRLGLYRFFITRNASDTASIYLLRGSNSPATPSITLGERTTDWVSRTVTGSPVYTPGSGPNENTPKTETRALPVPTSYRQMRTWTGRNPDNNADVTLTTYGTWTSDSANVPQDAPGITSDTSTETNEYGERRDTIIWTDGANTAYQRSAFYAPTSMEYRERQEWGGTETNALSGEPTRGYTFGAWQDTPPAEAPHPELWNETDLPPDIVRAAGTEGNGQYQDEWSRVWRIFDSLHRLGLYRFFITRNASDTASINLLRGSNSPATPPITLGERTTDWVSRTVTESPVYTPAGGPNENTPKTETRELP